ncbi:hypothetical protein chiPu_0019814 [Chiloscyllium punctatum]|uniref:Uncharacterized protein n=1 Tax=Chiloscyllium punctatum TaxID=137246 RepID=A0A401RT70_CHIPU|nr:hypothetical protein [Chiloscyllium punctatum]
MVAVVGVESNGEDEDDIKVTVSPVTNWENLHSDELYRGQNNVTISSHTCQHPWERSCKQAWDSSHGFDSMHPDSGNLESLVNRMCPLHRVRTEGECQLGKNEDQGTCRVGKAQDMGLYLQDMVGDQGTRPLGKVGNKELGPASEVKDQGSCREVNAKNQVLLPPEMVNGEGSSAVGRVREERSCSLGNVEDEGLGPSSWVEDQGVHSLGDSDNEELCSSSQDKDQGLCSLGNVKEKESCPSGQVKDQGSCLLDNVKDKEPIPSGWVKDQGACSLGNIKDEGSCPSSQVKGKGSCLIGPTPLHWMWEGFSVERYAPRRRLAENAGEGSRVKTNGDFQTGPPPEGGSAWRCRQGARPRTAESPGTCRWTEIPHCASFPGRTQAGRTEASGQRGRRTGRAPPASRRHLDEPTRGACAAPTPGGVTTATAGRRPAQAQNPPPLPPRCRAEQPPPRTVKAYREFLRQYRSIVEDGRDDKPPTRDADEFRLKATKLVEQRHQLVRKTIMEKERKERMEQKKLSKERMRRRKLEREIAVRISVYEMDKWRRTQASKKLQSFRKYNREQTVQYQAELREMKERVARSPFLFEQVIQSNVRRTISRLFSKVLQKVRLDEEAMCELSRSDCGTESQLIDLEDENSDCTEVCALRHGQPQHHTSCGEPLDTASCELNLDCDSTSNPRTDPATNCSEYER